MLGGIHMEKCGKQCEVYSRIVGYYRPVQNWNAGKREEFKDRLEFSESKTMQHEAVLEKPVPVPAARHVAQSASMECKTC